MPDPIQNAIQYSLAALAQRQRISSTNLANINTPGYLSKETNFEASFRRALEGRTTPLETTTTTSLAPTNVTGNNVDIDNETVRAMDTQLRYQTMVNAMNSKFRLLRTAIGTSI